jgi:hypothetical protein
MDSFPEQEQGRWIVQYQGAMVWLGEEMGTEKQGRRLREAKRQGKSGNGSFPVSGNLALYHPLLQVNMTITTQQSCSL